MLKLRPLPVFMTLIVSATILFGGWYFYQHNLLEQPLQKQISSIHGVETASSVIDPHTVTVNLKLSSAADLRSIYEEIQQKTTAAAGSRELKLEITNQSSTELNNIWSSELFTVAEAMENKSYSKIPVAMKQLEKLHEGLQVTSDIDDVNVYITMKKGSAVDYIILPRVSDKMGVWPNA